MNGMNKMKIVDVLIDKFKRMPTRKSLFNGRICAFKNKRCSARTCRYYYENGEFSQCEERAQTAKEIGAYMTFLYFDKQKQAGQQRKGPKRRARLLIKLRSQEAARRSRLHIFGD